MAGIDHLIGPGEAVVYRARFGAMRVFYEAIAVAIGLGVGVLTGPGILLAILFLGVWFYSERGLQRIVVTNQRVIHKQGWVRPRVDEIALTQVESIKNNGQRIVIIGSGGTKLKLPAYIADEAGLGRAIRQGRMAPQGMPFQGIHPSYARAAGASGPLLADSSADQTSYPHQEESVPAPYDGEGMATMGSITGAAAGAHTSKPPLWKRPAFIAIACLLGWPFLVMPFVGGDNEPHGAVNEPAPQSALQLAQYEGSHIAAAAANEVVSIRTEGQPAHDPGALPEAVLTVTEADMLPYARRSLVVRLTDEIDEPTIIEIGKLLQAEAPRYRSTYVDFYLPDMVEGAGAWASLHLERGSPPEVLGLGDMSGLKRAVKNTGSGGDIIGKWRDDRPYVKSLMVMRGTGESFVLTRTFADGEVMEQRLKERSTSAGRRFDILPEDGEGYGEYVILRSDGTLAFYDADGLIFVARSAS